MIEYNVDKLAHVYELRKKIVVTLQAMYMVSMLYFKIQKRSTKRGPTEV